MLIGLAPAVGGLIEERPVAKRPGGLKTVERAACRRSGPHFSKRTVDRSLAARRRWGRVDPDRRPRATLQGPLCLVGLDHPPTHPEVLQWC